MKKPLLLLLLLTASAFGAVTSVKIVPDTTKGLYVAPSGTIQLTLLCTYDNHAPDNCAFGGTATWTAWDTSFVTVNSSGVATGVVAGIGYVSASVGGVIGGAAIDCNTAVYTSIFVFPITAIEPMKTAIQLVVGTTAVLSANANDVHSGPIVTDDCSWSSSNTAVLTVTTAGEITAIGAGTANATCSVNGVSGSVSVAVTSPTDPGVYTCGDGVSTGDHTHCWWINNALGGTRYSAANTSGQCNGHYNQAYPGSGTNQNCAWSNVMYLVTTDTGTGSLEIAMAGGDTAIVVETPTLYQVGYRANNTRWNFSQCQSGSACRLSFPSGLPNRPTRFIGDHYGSCSDDSLKPQLGTFQGGFDFSGTQNFEWGCMDFGNSSPCGLSLGGSGTAPLEPNCSGTGTYDPTGTGNPGTAIATQVDGFTAGVTFTDINLHGFATAINGGEHLLQLNNTNILGNSGDGINFADTLSYTAAARPFGLNGSYLEISYSGCKEEWPVKKTVSSAVRDGSGNLVVTFPSGGVNFVSTNNVKLTGFTPSDMNGTFPVSAVTFNQQTQNITGGTCNTSLAQAILQCTINTSGTPAFHEYDLVKMSGVTPPWLNQTFMVWKTIGNSFEIHAATGLPPGHVTATSDPLTQFPNSQEYCSGTTYVPYYVITDTNGNAQQVTVGGIPAPPSGSPAKCNQTWSTTLNGTTVDGGVTWKMIGASWLTVQSGGTVSTANAITVTQAGSATTASVNGKAQHPKPYYWCSDQNGGNASGDGLGTVDSNDSPWTCDHCTFIRNTQDGWDVLHSASTKMDLTNSIAIGNEGQQVKMGAAQEVLMQNDFILASCGQNGQFDPDFPPEYWMQIATLCRAADGVPINILPWSQVTVSGIDFISSQTTFFSIGGISAGSASASISSHNSFYQGVLDPLTQNAWPRPAPFYCSVGPCPPTNTLGYNRYFNINGAGVCPGSLATGESCGDPQVVTKLPNSIAGEVDYLTYNYIPISTSVLNGAGVAGYDLSPALNGVARPAPPSIGAYEYASAPTTPSAPAPFFATLVDEIIWGVFRGAP